MVDKYFEKQLFVGGKTNSLGEVNEIVRQILDDRRLLDGLYSCFFSDDAWVRMRAADAFEKVCRVMPIGSSHMLIDYRTNFPRVGSLQYSGT